MHRLDVANVQQGMHCCGTQITTAGQFAGYNSGQVHTGAHILWITSPTKCQAHWLLSHWQTLSSWNTTADDWRPYDGTSAVTVTHICFETRQSWTGTGSSQPWFIRWFHDVKPKAMWPQIGHGIWGSPKELTGEVDLIARTGLWPSHCVRLLHNLPDTLSFDGPIAKGANLKPCIYNAAIKEAQWNGWNPFSSSCCLSCPVSLVYPHPVLAQNKLIARRRCRCALIQMLMS